jgi:salicylate synthase
VVRSVSPAELMHTAELLDGQPLPQPAPQPVSVDVDEHAAEQYEKAVAQVVDQIRRGKLHKAIISRTVPVPFAVDLTATYQVGRRANTPARSFLLDLAGTRAAGYSPETITEVTGGRVSTQPLAGTRARGGDQHTNAALRQELESNLKELGEHGMSIIAAREEMRNLCIPHTLVATNPLDVVPRGSVQHLATRLEGDLEIGATAWDALAMLFPAITASGIPKPAAYRAIHDLEPPRGLYAGAVVAADLTSGDLDAALVLRAAFIDRDGHAVLRAGAGIVADSEPAREYLETCEKLGSIAPYLVPATAQQLAEAV